MRGTIEKLPSGSWRITVALGKDPTTGKYQRTRATVNGTRKDAERELTKLQREIDTGAFVEPARLTVGEYLDKWLEDYVETIIQKPKTRTYYRTHVNGHLKPALGFHLLAKLTATHVQGYYRDKLAQGLSTTTVHGHAQSLHRALECAVKWGLVGRNVADAAESPKRRRVEMTTWTPEECLRFLAAAKGNRYYPFFATAIYTGLRTGELLGLRWPDLDLDNGLLVVQQTLEKSGTEPSFGTPKTAKSRRTLPLSPDLVTTLRAWKAAQNVERLALGPEYAPYNLVFTQAGGGPVDVDNLRRRDFARLVESAGVPRIRLHDLRHGFASLLLGVGFDLKLVSDLMGHSNVSTTADVYGHLALGPKREAANVLGRILTATATG